MRRELVLFLEALPLAGIGQGGVISPELIVHSSGADF
jgi:hypothetical protein